ncbi:MAG: aconitate hydratase AcnA [Rickettsia sp.]|nr:aconitate hydratase AcnA [Rickettsia sp.]
MKFRFSPNEDYKSNLQILDKKYYIYDINKAAKAIGINLLDLPYSLRILFENVLRTKANNLESFKQWILGKNNSEIEFFPTRVLMQDFTGVPAVVDLAAMRDAIKTLNGSPEKINPLIPVDLVIDHSVQVDYYGKSDAFQKNVSKEFDRNLERYKILKWAQNNFTNFKVVPPGKGICHQVNIEYLTKIIWCDQNKQLLYPDSLVGTDSHTTMVNALAVLGWGVGGIEAESAMLGESIGMILPPVIGVEFVGELNTRVNATDLVLFVTNILRKYNVVNKFVEFFGSGLSALSLADRATIANMAPECGSTCNFFPVDDKTLDYMRLTSRTEEEIAIIKEYSIHQNLFLDNSKVPKYHEVIKINLSEVEISLAGPKRPQDLVYLSDVNKNFQENFGKIGKKKNQERKNPSDIQDGDVVIAAITSCTNTSNPYAMIAAALLAKKAVELKINTKKWVKTSLAPGSQVVTDYLTNSGLLAYLEKLGFHIVGYGCTTCIGNSGPLLPEIEENIKANSRSVVAILSGNRNFEGRIHQLVKANYLASPMLVVLYSLIGNIHLDVTKDTLLENTVTGKKIFLEDIWPKKEEIEFYIQKYVNQEMFQKTYKNIFLGEERWSQIQANVNPLFNWDKNSTYINNPPYLKDIKDIVKPVSNINNARILAILGDSVTTDHISPAGAISVDSPAAKYLLQNNISYKDFNSYGSRRGNHEVMMRGTFANTRLKNKICTNIEGGYTIYHPSSELKDIYTAAMLYKAQYIPLVIFAGSEYGTGSSRDWAAKGTKLLGIKAIICESFERIHRSNLVGMGVLPITMNNVMLKDLNLKGDEIIEVIGLDTELHCKKQIEILIYEPQQKKILKKIEATLQLHTDSELNYIQNDNLLLYVTKKLSSNA